MVDSTLGGIVVLLLAGVVLLFVNPIIALVPLLLLFALLGLKLAGGAFRHAAPTADAGNGPAVPSTEQASYDPVADPSDRGA
jgi:hypothetical protein